jgi:hypothetical protein
MSYIIEDGTLDKTFPTYAFTKLYQDIDWSEYMFISENNYYLTNRFCRVDLGLFSTRALVLLDQRGVSLRQNSYQPYLILHILKYSYRIA